MKFFLFSLFFFFPFNALAVAPTMQNDTESISLPSGVSESGEATVIFDNPFLIDQWAQGSTNPYTQYLEALTLTTAPNPQGAVVISMSTSESGTTSGATPELFVDTLASSGLSYTPPPPGVPGGNILVSGSLLRQALLEKGIRVIEIPGWNFDDTRFVDDAEFYRSFAAFDHTSLAVVAAAVVFKNQEIDQIQIVDRRIIVSYRGRGWLLGVIPYELPVTLTINSAGTTDGDRVSARYPWYRFFMWMELSPRVLVANLNASLIGIQAAGIDSELAHAKLVSYVGALLSTERTGAVSGLE